jgi:hypothetical protein
MGDIGGPEERAQSRKRKPAGNGRGSRFKSQSPLAPLRPQPKLPLARREFIYLDPNSDPVLEVNCPYFQRHFSLEEIILIIQNIGQANSSGWSLAEHKLEWGDLITPRLIITINYLAFGWIRCRHLWHVNCLNHRY